MDAKGINYIRVGVFVLLGLFTAAALIFIIGGERHMFRHKVGLHTSFRDVAGLRSGSPVRIGGIDVGTVTTVQFSGDPNDPNIHVDFEIISTSLPRVRRNSIARVVSKGLLGDKTLEVTVGDTAQPGVSEGATLPGEATDELASAMHGAAVLIERANTLVNNVVTATGPLANPQLGENLLSLTRDLRVITNEIVNGNGTVARLIRDENMANRVDATLASAQAVARDIQATSSQVQAMTREVRTNDGLLHGLIYGPGGGRAVQALGTAADEVAAITHDIRTGTGGLHDIIYGHEGSQVMVNLNQVTASVRDIMRDVQRGRGTLGALLVDPSLYEDLKTLVGNVQRNEILRAMVRYSIRTNDRGQQNPPAAQPVPQPAR